MFDKKKLNFWRLVFIFTAFTLTVLFLLWNSPKGNVAKMMQNDMGSMMKMHTSNLKIYDLLQAEEHAEHHGSAGQTGNAMSDTSSQHQHGNHSLSIYRLSYLSTALIFLLLPLIIAGVIILAIVWIS